MNIGNGGYTQAAAASGPFAGFDKKLFKGDEDLLSQDFQTPAEPGQNKYNTGSGVYPVMKVSLSNNMGDGPSIDAMVAASKEFVNKMDEQNYHRVRTMFPSTKHKKLPEKKFAKEAYYGGEEQRKKDEKKKKIDAFMDRAMPKRTFDQMGRETDRRTGKLKEEDNFTQKKKILKRAKPLHKHLYKNLHKKDMDGDVNEVYSNSDASRAEKYSRDDKDNKQFAKDDKLKKFGKFVKDAEAVRGKRKGMRGTSKGKWGTFNKGVFTPDN